MAQNYEFRVLEQHLDTFGHVNHATYAVLFEEARWEMITARGYGLKKVIELQKGPIIIEMKLRFKSELRLRETIKIVSTVENPKRRIQRIHQEMIKEDGSIACEADYMVGFFDMKTRELIAPPSQWVSAVD